MKLSDWSHIRHYLVRFLFVEFQPSQRALCLASTVGGNAEPRRGMRTLLGVGLQDDLHWHLPPSNKNSSRVSHLGPIVPSGRF